LFGFRMRIERASRSVMNNWLGSVTDDAIESCGDGRNSCEKPVVRSPVALAAKEHVAKVAVVVVPMRASQVLEMAPDAEVLVAKEHVAMPVAALGSKKGSPVLEMVRDVEVLAVKEHAVKVAEATAVWETKLLERARTQVVVVVPAIAARERVVMVRGEVPHGHRERSRMG
jgi:hypothetical protein